MKQLKKLPIFLMLLLFTIPVFSQEEDPPPPNQMAMQNSKGKMKMREFNPFQHNIVQLILNDKELNLTTTQKNTIIDIETKYQKKSLDLLSELKKSHENLKSLLDGNNFNENKFKELSYKINDLRKQLANLKTDMFIEIVNTLNSDQKSKLFEKIKQRPFLKNKRKNKSSRK